MTPEARHRSLFELRRFSAAPVSADLAVVELEGTFGGTRGRFTRQPVLVVEEPGGGPRAELTPVRVRHDDDRWYGVYAAPLRALDGGTFALGAGGVLHELPAPDATDDGDRLAAVAREANRLRRRIEALEAQRDVAAADAAQARAELEVAVAAARDEVAAQSAQRIDDLEREVVAAHETAAGDAERARAAADGERHAAIGELEQRLAEERERAEVAQARAAAAEERERHEAAGADVLRAELAEERERAQAAIAELQERLDAEEPRTTVAPRRVTEPDPTRTMDLPAAEDDDERGPVPIARRPPPRHQAPPAAPPVQHRGPALSPWIAVGALFVFAFLVVALLLNLLG